LVEQAKVDSAAKVTQEVMQCLHMGLLKSRSEAGENIYGILDVRACLKQKMTLTNLSLILAEVGRWSASVASQM
jgi:hypothetical protein